MKSKRSMIVRVFSAFLSVLLLVLLCMPTFAVSEKTPVKIADALHSLGLFQGTDLGYELDHSLTREQGVTMVVRLTGKEQTALAQNIAHQFTDCDDWFSPYLGYAFTNAITYGVSDTLFGYGESLSQSNYLTFMLRVLGYDDQAGDFSWDAPETLASQLGITHRQSGKVFLRSDMVAISWETLHAALKDSTDTLADLLISEGVFSSSAYAEAERIAAGAASGNGFYEEVSSGSVLSAASAVGSFAFRPLYHENHTRLSGTNTQSVNGTNIKVTYQSTFYGSDSAINRDYCQYGWRFDEVSAGVALNQNVYYADFNGDRFADAVYYENGKLQILTSEVDTGSAAIADGTSTFKLEKAASYDVGVGAVLSGVGDFNGDGYTDILLTEEDRISVYYTGTSGLTRKSYRPLSLTANDQLMCGDVDGDGLCDLIVLNGTSVTVYWNRGNGFAQSNAITLALGTHTLAAVGDVNGDSRADLVLYDDGTLRTLFGRGDGRFGPDSSELNNYNLFGTYEYETISALMVGDVSGDKNADVITMTASGKVNYLIGIDEPAYDYSADVLKTDNGYILYSGSRWFDQSPTLATTGDGDHILYSWSPDGITWYRNIEGPTFQLGRETGATGWWIDNTLEPEVIYVNGTYHMFWQCSYTTPKGNYGDKIGYASSTDGIHFTRKTDTPVIINADSEIGFSHQEVIYVPDDPTGQCWWMYVTWYNAGTFMGHIRIRSASPTSFNFENRETTTGIAQIGNQIGYISNYDGNGTRLFVRITFATSGEQSVPALQFSLDALNWNDPTLLLASVDASDPVAAQNTNAYFLGMSTINGTGEIEKTADGKYKIVYVATTCKTAVAPKIFQAEMGVGEMTFTLN